MLKKIVFCLLMGFLVVSTLLSAQGEGWETCSYTRWSPRQVETVLNGSPWTALIYAGPQPSCELVSTDRVFYRIRLITAKPIREALLRQALFREERVITLEQLRKGAAAEDEFADKFIASNPHDVRVTGDDRHIILSVTLAEITYKGWEEYNDGESLSGSGISSIGSEAFLQTNSGARMALARYEPPGPDRLGAKLYFERSLPDGKSLITPGDKELRLITRVRDKAITVCFDLRRMKYQGELEF